MDTAPTPAPTVADLDRLARNALDLHEDLIALACCRIAERSAITPDSFSADPEMVAADTTLTEAVECEDYLVPVEVTGWAIVRRVWAVRIPIGGDDGEVEGDEVMTFATKAEADAYVAAALAEPPASPAATEG